MADNYTIFSEQIEDITPEQAEWIETVLGFDTTKYRHKSNAKRDLAQALGRRQSPYPKEVNDADLGRWPGFEWQIKGAEQSSLWLYCVEGYDENNLILFVQSFIRIFKPDLIFTLSCANTCSQPRLNEFGGGWLVITNETVIGGSTWEAIAVHTEAIKRIRKEKQDGDPT